MKGWRCRVKGKGSRSGLRFRKGGLAVCARVSTCSCAGFWGKGNEGDLILLLKRGRSDSTTEHQISLESVRNPAADGQHYGYDYDNGGKCGSVCVWTWKGRELVQLTVDFLRFFFDYVGGRHFFLQHVFSCAPFYAWRP